MVDNYKRDRAVQRVTDRDSVAYAEGARAKLGIRTGFPGEQPTGDKISDNPYERGTTAHREWSRGYRAGRRYQGK
jgi:hypothetical protein